MSVDTDGPPSSGSWFVDLITDVIALDLFLMPSRAQTLAAYWLGTFAPRPSKNQPRLAFDHLIRALPDAFRSCALRLTVHEVGGGRLGFALGLFDTRFNLAVSRDFLVRTRAWRTLTALVLATEPVTDTHRHIPFLTRSCRGMRGELVCTDFRGDARLAYYLSAPHFAVLVAHVFAQWLGQIPALRATPPALARLTEAAATVFAEMGSRHQETRYYQLSQVPE